MYTNCHIIEPVESLLFNFFVTISGNSTTILDFILLLIRLISLIEEEAKLLTQPAVTIKSTITGCKPYQQFPTRSLS